MQAAVDSLQRLAVSRFERLAGDPNSASSFTALGHCYLILNDFPNAYACYGRVLQIEPNLSCPYFWYGVGSVFQHFHYNSQASMCFRHALEMSDGFSMKSDLILRLALVQRSLSDHNASISLLESIASAPPLELKEEDIKFQIAFSLQLAGQQSRCSLIYRDLYSRHANVIALVQQYCWFLLLSDDSVAFQEADQVLQHSDESDPILQLLSARLAMKRQDIPLAYRRYCDCMALWNDSPLFWCGLGTVYIRNEQWADAIFAFQQALYLKHDLNCAWANLALIFEIQGQSESAARVYRTGLENCPGDRLLAERMNAGGRRGRKFTVSDAIDGADEMVFTQPADQIANEYLSDSPQLPGDLIGGPELSDLTISELALPHRSIF
jgi:tetratricopeptide (TPR) repeat protein